MSLAEFPAFLDRVAQGTASPEDCDALEAMAEAAPGHVTAHIALARACELNDRPEAARHRWKQARLLLPGSPAVRAGLRRTASASAAPSAPPVEEPPEPAPSEQDRAVPDRQEAHAEPESRPPAEKARGEEASGEEAPGEKPAPGASGSELPGALLAAIQEASGPASASGPARSAEDADLDSLIEELDGARIEPTPNPDDVPAPDLDTGAEGDVVSPTLARIYEAQGQFAEAARVHRRLAEEHPDAADEHRRQAEVLERRVAEESERESEEENR